MRDILYISAWKPRINILEKFFSRDNFTSLLRHLYSTMAQPRERHTLSAVARKRALFVALWRIYTNIAQRRMREKTREDKRRREREEVKRFLRCHAVATRRDGSFLRSPSSFQLAPRDLRLCIYTNTVCSVTRRSPREFIPIELNPAR